MKLKVITAVFLILAAFLFIMNLEACSTQQKTGCQQHHGMGGY